MSSDIGTLEWGRRTTGLLSASDQVRQLSQGMAIQLSAATAALLRRLGLTSRRQAMTQEIRIPDTPVARAATQLCTESSPGFLANHCFRTFAWGVLFGARDDVRYDAELLYVACVLHDIGLTRAVGPTALRTACFAVNGANTAAHFVEQLGWPTERRDVVAEAISMHLNVGVSPRSGTEAHLLHEGAALDVAGMRYGDISREAREKVVGRHPRLGFKTGVSELLSAEAAAHPGCRAHFLIRALKFDRMIARSPFAD